MMALPTLQIQVLCGPWAGRRLALHEVPVVCGRDPSSIVLLDGPHVSRKHCELIDLDGQWAVVNHSPNGLRVNGRKVAGKPVLLEDGATLSVGDADLFRVNLGPAPAVEQPAEPAQESDAAGSAAAATDMPRRKTKLWIGIGVYLVLLLGLFIYVSTIQTKSSNQSVQPAELTAEQIEQDVRRPRPKPPGGADERVAQQYLEQARQLSQRTALTVDGHYRAYDAFRLSLAAVDKRVFDLGTDQTRFQDLQDTMVRQVTELYKEAYLTLRSLDYKSASDKFKQLMDMYPDNQSAVFRNAEQQRRYAIQKIGKKKF